MTITRSKPALGLAMLALIAAPLVLGAPAAMARVDVGIDVGIPGLVVAPPVMVAPPPVAYAAPPVYAAPPPVVVAPGPYVAANGYWWYDQWGHRHWRRR
jgi:hypothetical protein